LAQHLELAWLLLGCPYTCGSPPDLTASKKALEEQAILKDSRPRTVAYALNKEASISSLGCCKFTATHYV
jgi:hypothetical protein